MVIPGTEVHLFELRDDIKEMCHTKPLVDYRYDGGSNFKIHFYS